MTVRVIPDSGVKLVIIKPSVVAVRVKHSE